MCIKLIVIAHVEISFSAIDRWPNGWKRRTRVHFPIGFIWETNSKLVLVRMFWIVPPSKLHCFSTHYMGNSLVLQKAIVVDINIINIK